MKWSHGSKFTKHRRVDHEKSPSHLFLPASKFLPLHYGDCYCFLCPQRDSRCMSKQSRVSFFFSLLYTILIVLHLAVVGRSSSCSWCPAHIPVAFVISGHAGLASRCQQPRALCGLSAHLCPASSPQADTAGRWVSIAAPSPPRVGKQTRTRCCSQMTPAGLSPAACRVALYGLPSLPCLTFPVPSKSLMRIVIN